MSNIINKEFDVLYARTNTGKVQQWQIIVKDDYFYTIAGQVDGKKTQSEPNYCIPKNVGKKNETSGNSQAHLEAEAKFDKKIKEGYKLNISEIDDIGFFEPMLAKKFVDYQYKIDYPVLWQSKLNGICCIIHIRNGKLGAFSRKGEEFYCLDHIKDELKELYKQWPKLVLHGELYNENHKNELNVIASLVSVNRKAKDVTYEDIKNSKNIVQFHIYDGFNFSNVEMSSPFEVRYQELQAFINNFKYSFSLKSWRADSEFDIKKALEESRKQKREGIMIKIIDAPYEQKRSKNILKLKNFEDDEFEIIGFREGSGNWNGCVKNVICKLNIPATNGKTEFDSNIKGTMEELKDLWDNKEKYIGQSATVVYQELSPYGIPLIPYTQLPFRTYESKNK